MGVKQRYHSAAYSGHTSGATATVTRPMSTVQGQARR